MEVYVGEQTNGGKPLLVQQSILQSLSDYFTKALRPEAFSEGRAGQLQFPEDGIDTWELLLSWAVKRSMPSWPFADSLSDVCRETLLTRSWVLGDKYQILQFQDEVMVELLSFYAESSGHQAEIKHAVSITAPGSKLRRLMAEELVHLIYDYDGMKMEKLDDFDGLGFFAEFNATRDRLQNSQQSSDSLYRFGRTADAFDVHGPAGSWRKYLVGDCLPRRQWRWDATEDIWRF